MRLGAPVSMRADDLDQWAKDVQRKGYQAVYCPLNLDADEETIREFVKIAHSNKWVVAEVGAWSNPLSPDATERQKALEKCKKALCLADKTGARCCVNIAGSRGKKWDGPDASDLTSETFDRIVETVRDIIDDVSPTRTFYTLETMPWMYPDSVDSYLALIRAIDRNAFAVHLDIVNLINCPERYFHQDRLIDECIDKLGGLTRSVHLKDIRLQDHLTVHLDEVRPGLGGLQFPLLLRRLARLDPDLPVMLEHLESEDRYDAAANFIREVARENQIAL
ncbi:MAG TPA: TIM barrel protein [Anaerolineaceae bacterium]